LVRRALDCLKEPPARNRSASLATYLRYLHYYVRLRAGLRYKINLVSEKWLTPQDWLYCPLPDRLFFLYYFMRPVLWIPRRLSGWRGRTVNGSPGSPHGPAAG
jgi:hypothetical protein